MITMPIGGMSCRTWSPIQSVRDVIFSRLHLVPDTNEYALQVQYNTKERLDTKRPSSDEPHLQIPNAYSGSDAFAALLSDSIDESLTDLLGIRAREAVYDFMEREYSVARNELAQHLDQLFHLFANTFGAAGRKVIGRAFAKKVYSKLEWEFVPMADFEFADYIDAIKAKIARELVNKAKSTERSGIQLI